MQTPVALPRCRHGRTLAAAALAVATSLAVGASASAGGGELYADARQWRANPEESGPVNYYRGRRPGLAAHPCGGYLPAYETAVLGSSRLRHGQGRAFHLP